MNYLQLFILSILTSFTFLTNNYGQSEPASSYEISKRSTNQEYFVPITDPDFQKAVIENTYIKLDVPDIPEYNSEENLIYFEDDFIFLVMPGKDASWIYAYDNGGNFINSFLVPFVTYETHLNYIAKESTLAVSNSGNNEIYKLNLETNAIDILSVDYSFLKAVYLENKDQWVFYTLDGDSPENITNKFTFTNELFEEIESLIIPFENSNLILAKSFCLKVIDDNLYFNSFGSHKIYNLTDASLEIVFEVPESYYEASGIFDFHLTKNSMYVLMPTKDNMYYSIYSIPNSNQKLYIPSASVYDPLYDDFKFFNQIPHGSDGKYLFIISNIKTINSLIENFGTENFDHLLYLDLDENDLIIQKYMIDTDLLLSISEDEVPSFLK